MDSPITVIKRGETYLITSLHRASSGLRVSVKAHPILEEFMQKIGGGEKSPITLFGRHWESKDPKETPLYVYAIAGIEPLISDDGSSILLDPVAQPLVIDRNDRYPPGSINLSFLRLVGISEGAGITFGVKGVYSTEGMGRIKQKIALAQRKFIQEYLRPMDMDIVVSTSELGL